MDGLASVGGEDGVGMEGVCVTVYDTFYREWIYRGTDVGGDG